MNFGTSHFQSRIRSHREKILKICHPLWHYQEE